MAKVWDIGADVDGQVRVDVGDYRTCCRVAPDLPQHQWRRYGMRDGAFVQTGGPTRFGPNPHVTDLAVAADAPSARRLPDGTWDGSLTVRVRNAGPFTVGTTSLALTGVNGLRPTRGWDACPFPPTGGTDDIEISCVYAPVEPGEVRTFTFGFTSSTRPTGAITVSTSSTTLDGHSYYRDAHHDDDTVTVVFPDLGRDTRRR
ncbi:MAG TPA: hypothetical protein VFY17_00750 [Pilimelia sp.]|nr:hypothetical protein [Pilimelia sp.]